MKKCILFICMIVALPSFALQCNEKNGEGTLILKAINKSLVEGSIIGPRAIGSIFVGTTSFIGGIKTEYNLYNQHGEEFTFITQFELPSHHCRARVCPAPKFPPLKSTTTLSAGLIGKLIMNGEENVYYDCL